MSTSPSPTGDGIFASALRLLGGRPAEGPSARSLPGGVRRTATEHGQQPLSDDSKVATSTADTNSSQSTTIHTAGSAHSSNSNELTMNRGVPHSSIQSNAVRSLDSSDTSLTAASASTVAGGAHSISNVREEAGGARSTRGTNATSMRVDAGEEDDEARVINASVRGSIRAGGREWVEDSGGGAHATPNRVTKFARLLESDSVDVEALRRLAWSGVPARYRAAAWQTLLGYLPPTRARQAGSILKKTAEYQQIVADCFGRRASGGMGKSDKEQTLLRQVLVDVPRTHPEIPLFHVEFVQRSLERVLFVWAMRHPASGYVQGINDLATPFYAVFLAPWADIDCRDLSHVNADRLAEVEADVYWCLTRLLDGIQDHYTPSQPGIQKMIYRLRELVHRIDEPLVQHLEGNSVEFHQFAFRWCNCLLMRELPFRLICRLWDTCLTEKDGFEGFYVYICAALLLRFSPRLKALSFQELVQFLQKLPTREWTVKDIEELLSQAYVYKTLFDAAPSHLN